MAAVNRIAYSEDVHPFSLQVMYAERPPFPIDPEHPQAGNRWGYINMGYGLRKHPRVEDGITFTDEELDYRGLPNFTIDYALTEREEADVERSTALLRRIGSALGTFVAEPRLLPNGSSLHYQGTMRMGAVDDGTSVADPWSRVWGFENLVVGGQRPHPDRDEHEPDAHERRDRGARRACPRDGAGPMTPEETRAFVTEFARVFYTERDVEAAFERFVAEDYIQHNPTIPDGRDAAVAMLVPKFSTPGATFEIQRILVDGDLALIHVKASFPRRPGRGSRRHLPDRGRSRRRALGTCCSGCRTRSPTTTRCSRRRGPG